MKIEKNINYKHIGNVMYRKNKRAKNISIRINSKGEIKVTVPAWCTYRRAEMFVLEKEDWIIQKGQKIQGHIQEKFAWKKGDSISILNGKIDLIEGLGSSIGEMQVGRNYLIELPPGFDPQNPASREMLLSKLSAIGLAEGKEQLPSILQALSSKHHLNFQKVTVKRMRTRWGSCSSTNNISLNSALVFLPMDLIEYVCLHELMHTIHKNHSATFWSALEAILPGTRKLRNSLHEQSMII